MDDTTSQPQLSLKVRAGVMAVVLAVGVVLALVAPLQEWTAGLSGWLEAGGMWAACGFVVLFGVWNVLLPPMPLQILAGFVYGIVNGMLVIYAGSTLAIILAFGLARSILRGPIERALAKRRVWRAVDKAFAEEGWRAVLLLRLSNIMPSNLANVACGASGQKLWTVLWASWLGKAPGILMTVLIGEASRQAINGESGSHVGTYVSLGIGIVATGLMSWLLAKRTKALLQAEEALV